MILDLIFGTIGIAALIIFLIIGACFLLGSSPNGGRAKYYRPAGKSVTAPMNGGHAPDRWQHTGVTERVCIDRQAAAYDQARRLHALTAADRRPQQEPAELPAPQPGIVIIHQGEEIPMPVTPDSIFARRK